MGVKRLRSESPCGYGALHQRGVKNDTHRLPVARETVGVQPAAKDRYFHLAASSVPLPFVLPVVLALSSSSSYLLLSLLVGALLAVRCDP